MILHQRETCIYLRSGDDKIAFQRLSRDQLEANRAKKNAHKRQTLVKTQADAVTCSASSQDIIWLRIPTDHRNSRMKTKIECSGTPALCLSHFRKLRQDSGFRSLQKSSLLYALTFRLTLFLRPPVHNSCLSACSKPNFELPERQARIGAWGYASQEHPTPSLYCYLIFQMPRYSTNARNQ